MREYKEEEGGVSVVASRMGWSQAGNRFFSSHISRYIYIYIYAIEQSSRKMYSLISVFLIELNVSGCNWKRPKDLISIKKINVSYP